MDTESIYKGMGEIDLGEKVIQLQGENKKLLEHARKLEDDVEMLCQEIIKMKKEKDALSKNISELFNTAKREIDRKSETITQLREQLDDICFRRKRAPYNVSWENKREFNRNNNEKCEDKKSHSKSPQRSEKENTKSKTPIRLRSRSSSSSSKRVPRRDHDKTRSPNRYRSRSRSLHRFKRRRSPSFDNQRGIRRRRRSREYHSKGHLKREDHHREKIENRRNSLNHRSDREFDKEKTNQRTKGIEKNSSARKHYLLQEFEKLYNEDIDTEDDPSPFSNRPPFKRVPDDQNKNDEDDDKAHSLLTEIYKKSESLISEEHSRMVENTIDILKKDCDSKEICLETPESNNEIITKDPDLSGIHAVENKIENVNCSHTENSKDTENKECNSSVTATQQSIGRRRRRCVLKIKE